MGKTYSMPTTTGDTMKDFEILIDAIDRVESVVLEERPVVCTWDGRCGCSTCVVRNAS